MTSPDQPVLRRCVLAVSVLWDVDVHPGESGVSLPGRHAHATISWTQLAEALDGLDPESGPAQHRVRLVLRAHTMLADLGVSAAQSLLAASRLVALPPGHMDHLGAGWVQERLPGGALDLGIGVRGLLGDTRVCPLPPSAAGAIGLDPRRWWGTVRTQAEDMGALAAARLRRDADRGVLRPVGGCDVPALLSSGALRRQLASGDGSGLRAVAIPTRQRGWFELRQLDRDFVQAAWSLTNPPDRGVATPVLVSAHEVALPVR